MPGQLSRRALLSTAALGVAASVVSACTGASGPEAPPRTATPDERARLGAARREQSLAERAAATVQRHPELSVAAAAAAAHTAHADALFETLPPASMSPQPSGSGGGSGTPSPSIPGSRREAAKDLSNAEQAAAEAHRATLALAGITGNLARLLASVAASDVGFAYAVQTQGRS